MAENTPKTDLQDSEKDQQKLKQDKAIIDLPDVKDIPGQENVHVPELREMADTTISSDDEEGTGLFGEDDANYSSERLPVGEELDENDLVIGDDEELEADLDEEENEDSDEDDIDITDDSVSTDSDVTEDEKIALERTASNMDTQDNENLYRSELDDKDFDGEKLNEDDDDVSGKDLDVPGAEEDDANEDIGEEDEENNEYSLGDTE